MTPTGKEAIHAWNCLSCHFAPCACWIYEYIASQKVVLNTSGGDEFSTNVNLFYLFACMTYSYCFHFTKVVFELSISLIWNNCSEPHVLHIPSTHAILWKIAPSSRGYNNEWMKSQALFATMAWQILEGDKRYRREFGS